MTPWWTWLQRHLDERGWTGSDLARHADINRSIIGRWRREGAHPEVPTARALAAALHKPLLEVLVAAEVLTPAEAGLTDVEAVSVPRLGDEELLAELAARLRRTAGAGAGLRLTETTTRDLAADEPPPCPPTRARRSRSH